MYTRYVLRIGDKGIAVNKIQAYLNMFVNSGYITTRVTPDGIFGPRTQSAVREIQSYLRINPDGVIGNATWDGIFELLKRMNVMTNIPTASASYYFSVGNYGIDVLTTFMWNGDNDENYRKEETSRNNWPDH